MTTLTRKMKKHEEKEWGGKCGGAGWSREETREEDPIYFE